MVLNNLSLSLMISPGKFGRFPWKSKDQVLGVFKQFKASVERETEKKTKCIHTDDGGEYIGPNMHIAKSKGLGTNSHLRRHHN